MGFQVCSFNNLHKIQLFILYYIFCAKSVECKIYDNVYIKIDVCNFCTWYQNEILKNKFCLESTS
jgi:hypothetical protein